MEAFFVSFDVHFFFKFFKKSGSYRYFISIPLDNINLFFKYTGCPKIAGTFFEQKISFGPPLCKKALFCALYVCIAHYAYTVFIKYVCLCVYKAHQIKRN
jgi:hypothetical protein